MRAKLKHSIHGGMFACVDCHKDVKSLVHETTPQKITCAQCHADAQDAYAHSTHAIARKEGAPAAGCQDCHGGAHEVMAAGDPKSPVNHENIPYTCGRCHGQKFLMESRGESAQPFISYQESVHGRATEKGSQKAAVCTDCHGAHEILAANDAKSPIYKFNVPATCGKCHTDIDNTFMQSIHGQAIARGNAQAPVCTDCHGIHSIKAHADPNSPAAEQEYFARHLRPLPRGRAAVAGVRRSRQRVSSYFDSYHGLAAEGGSVVAANCSSCHGVHNILPSSDPRSTINRANLDTTCGQVPQGRHAEVHADARAPGRWRPSPRHRLACGALGAADLHCSDSARYRRHVPAQLHHLAQQGGGAAQDAESLMVRMTANQRWQHLILLTSFIILVITGFALKFPDTWFAHVLGMGEQWRGIIHRVAGVILIGAGIYHVFYLAAAREGRRLIRDLAPRPRMHSTPSTPCSTTLACAARSRSSRASTTRRRPSTGRWCGARR